MKEDNNESNERIADIYDLIELGFVYFD
jgi:hypothetical protein